MRRAVARRPSAAAATAATIKNCKLVQELVLMLLFLLPKLMLPLAAASASCRLLCCCLRSWDGSGGSAANSAADTVAELPLLLARWFLCFSFCPFIRLVAAHPHLLPQCRRRRLHDLVYLVRNHTKIMIGREFTFCSGRKLNFCKTLFRTLLDKKRTHSP